MSNKVKIALNVLKDQFIGINPHDEDFEGFPIEAKIYVEHLSSDYDGIFPDLKAWRQFCSRNLDRAGNEGGFYTEGELKDSTRAKWICDDVVKRIVNNLYAKFNSKLWVEVEPDQVELNWTYELSGCDEKFYPNSVEFIVTATLKNPQ